MEHAHWIRETEERNRGNSTVCSANLQLWPSCLLHVDIYIYFKFFFLHLLKEWSSKSPTITEKSIPASASFVRSGTRPQSVRLNYRECGCQQGLKQIDLPRCSLIKGFGLCQCHHCCCLQKARGEHEPFTPQGSHRAMNVFTCTLHVRFHWSLGGEKKG